MTTEKEILLPTAPGLPDCHVILTARSTLGLQITRTGEIVVRAPQHLPLSRIRDFIREKTPWLQKKLSVRTMVQNLPLFTAEEIAQMKAIAQSLFRQRVEKYAPMVGVTWNRITLRTQKSRWGSCSSDGNLSFNCLLVKAPLEVLDSVVIHELCHRRVMGHGDDFYALLYRICPAYDACHAWLKDNGAALINRLP